MLTSSILLVRKNAKFGCFRLIQENIKRENLRKELEFEFLDRDERVQRAFATSLEMQRNAEKEASALKAELTMTQLKSQQDIATLAEQVK